MKRALVLSLIVVIGLGVAGFAQTLGGEWFTKITVDLSGTAFPAAITVLSTLDVDYTVGDWTFSSYTKLTNGVWNDQDFDFVGVLGAFAISGSLDFDPDAELFEKLQVDVTVSIAGVSFGFYYDLVGVPAGNDLNIKIDGVAGDVTIGVDLMLGDEVLCDFDFNWVKVKIGFPFCCATVSSEIKFGCTTGFEYVWFKVVDITIENLPWLTLDAKVHFTEQTKTFTLSPSIDLGVIGCDFDLYYRLDSSGGILDALSINGIIFDGIQIACEIGGVQFTGITFLTDPNIAGLMGVYMYGYMGWGYYFPGILYGFEGYGTHPGPFFEAYQIQRPTMAAADRSAST